MARFRYKTSELSNIDKQLHDHLNRAVRDVKTAHSVCLGAIRQARDIGSKRQAQKTARDLLHVLDIINKIGLLDSTEPDEPVQALIKPKRERERIQVSPFQQGVDIDGE